MVPLPDLLLFIGAAIVMVLTPGPNMIYLVSRSISQGRSAGVISLVGVAVGLLVHVVGAAAGLTVLFMALPLAYEVLKVAGAIYLLYLAWQAVRPGARSPFEPRPLAPDSPRRLFAMGFLTAALNPKVAVFYLSIVPQFVDPSHGPVMAQSLELGCTQIMVSFTVNLMIVIFAGKLAAWFARRPRWLATQRYIMGSVLGGFALRLALEERR